VTSDVMPRHPARQAPRPPGKTFSCHVVRFYKRIERVLKCCMPRLCRTAIYYDCKQPRTHKWPYERAHSRVVKLRALLEVTVTVTCSTLSNDEVCEGGREAGPALRSLCTMASIQRPELRAERPLQPHKHGDRAGCSTQYRPWRGNSLCSTECVGALLR
jgi:hypothetical protein